MHVRPVAVVALVALAGLARQGAAQSTSRPQLVILHVDADLAAGSLRVEGRRFVWTSDDAAVVTLAGVELVVDELTDTLLVARLPSGLEPGCFRLAVSRGPGPVQNDTFPLTLGETGAPGEDGLACWDLDGDRACGATVEDVNGDGACDALDCKGPQGPAGPPGPRGADGPPGPAGGLELLDCLPGELPRFTGTTWRCAAEGASLLPAPTFGAGSGSFVPGTCTHGGCEETVPRVELTPGGSPAVWESFGGGGVRNVTEGLTTRLAVDELSITRVTEGLADLPRVSSRFGTSDRHFRAIEITPFAIEIAEEDASPWTGVRAGEHAPVWVTLSPASRDISDRAFEWWRRYAVGEDHPMDLVIERLTPTGRVLIVLGLDACVPVAWSPGALFARCAFGHYRRVGPDGQPAEPFGAWLDDTLQGEGGARRLEVAEVGSLEGLIQRHFRYEGAVISGYVFGDLVGENAYRETFLLRATSLDVLSP
jgi:hypothetical protein